MLKHNGLRLLTPGEIRLAKEIFGHSIQYHRVWVHHGSYLPFGLQEDNTAITPDGEMWFETHIYRDDYSRETIDLKHLFLHEMMHVRQHQRGMNVRIRGLTSWVVSYEYDLNQGLLSRYSMEQQASIVADYGLLINSLYGKYQNIINYSGKKRKESDTLLLEKYKIILQRFPL